ncbi:MAG: chemotaxis protein CheY [Paenibacillaceae bacterium]|jgi:NarL family two-component system response regulator YdfI|nr:chemotaxis protein CheY [Paenibacillaceae bacterium]
MSRKVMIVDDHIYIREGLKLILETNQSYEVVGEAEDGAAAIQLLESVKPDVILMDLNMPRMSGLEAIQAMKDRQWDIPVVIMNRGLALGAKGYLLKDAGSEPLFRTLESVLRGETLLQPAVMERVLRVKQSQENTSQAKAETVLTDRECYILQAIARGSRNKEIASDMGISERTVKAYLTNIYNKLGVDTRSEAVAIALDRGIVHL